MQISRITAFLHAVLSPLIRAGDTVVDCTLGNGHDALFLAEAAGSGGRLVGFDLQPQALDRTREKLERAGIERGRYSLIEADHAEIDRYVPAGIGAAVYNLGYLPGSGKAIRTKRETSIRSIGKALELLRPEGVVSVTLYYGHQGGREEAEGVQEFARRLDHARHKVLQLTYPNLPRNPPSILIIQRGTGKT